MLLQVIYARRQGQAQTLCSSGQLSNATPVSTIQALLGSCEVCQICKAALFTFSALGTSGVHMHKQLFAGGFLLLIR